MFAKPTLAGTPAEGECGADQGQQQRGDLEPGAGSRRPPKSRSVLGWQSRGEELGEQLVHALVLVVMHPVRRVRQALDAGQVGHVFVVRLG